MVEVGNQKFILCKALVKYGDPHKIPFGSPTHLRSVWCAFLTLAGAVSMWFFVLSGLYLLGVRSVSSTEFMLTIVLSALLFEVGSQILGIMLERRFMSLEDQATLKRILKTSSMWPWDKKPPPL